MLTERPVRLVGDKVKDLPFVRARLTYEGDGVVQLVRGPLPSLFPVRLTPGDVVFEGQCDFLDLRLCRGTQTYSSPVRRRPHQGVSPQVLFPACLQSLADFGGASEQRSEADLLHIGGQVYVTAAQQGDLFIFGQESTHFKYGEAVDDIPTGKFVLGSITPWYITRSHHCGNDDAGFSDPRVELSE